MDLALQLIKENKASKNKALDLGKTGLNDWPAELFELVHLEKLVLSNRFWNVRDEKWEESKNLGGENRLNDIPTSISKLKKLRYLRIGGSFEGQWGIENVAPLAHLPHLESLDLSYNKIVDILSLKKLNQLRTLLLSYNNISDISALEKQFEIQVLHLNSNNISDISSLRHFLNLKTLHLSSNNISDSSVLGHLSHLRTLYLNSNNISDITSLGELKALQFLHLNYNQMTDLSALQPLKQLQSLHLRSNKITDISDLRSLVNLEALNLRANMISDLTPLEPLTRLRSLDLRANHIDNIAVLENLRQLRSLHLRSNDITDVSGLKNLPQLLSLDLRNNAIENITSLKDLFLKERPTQISIEDNPVIHPPPEIVKLGQKAITKFFLELDEKHHKPLNEVKVILIGNGAAGKTSLVRRLVREPFNIEESQTHGIQIRREVRHIQNEEVTIHYWDFGGQDIMHTTHQFFLTRRCIYLLVMDSRKDEKAEYWLKHIQNFGGQAPAMVVLNKIDENPGFRMNEKFLQAKYSNIKTFHRVSCKTGEGLDRMNTDLEQLLWKLELRRTPFPATWIAVKTFFDQMNEDHISYQKYQQACLARGVVDKDSQHTLLSVLNDLGIILHYEKLKFYDTQVLNPLWLTNAVYRVINSPIVARTKGFFNPNKLDEIINDSFYVNESDGSGDPPLAISETAGGRYGGQKFAFIVAIMKQFELCFQLNDAQYIVPELLPVEQKPYTFPDQTNSLRLVVEYPEFLPKSIIPRLMVRMHRYIFGQQVWKTGMVLQEPTIFNSIANVISDVEEKRIYIEVQGREQRNFLSFIREEIKAINTSFENLEVTEWIPLPEVYKGDPLLVEYEELVGYEAAGEEQYFSGKLRKSFSVLGLLNGIEQPEQRRLLDDTMKVFLSYSRQDMNYKEELKKALMPLVRLNKITLWDDACIVAGQAWENEIYRQLEEADLVLCLISSDFIASTFAYDIELAQALEAHQTGEKVVIPVRARMCAWEDLPISRLQGLPDHHWIGAVRNDEAWTAVAKGLRKVINTILEKKQNRSPYP